jgi:hypothetical protein
MTMNARASTVIASGAWSLAAFAAASAIVIRLVRNDPIARNTFGMGSSAMLAFLVFGMAWASAGALLMTKRPDNATGRFVLLIGSAYVWSILFTSITFAGLADGSTSSRMIAGVAGWFTGLTTLLGGVAFNISILFPTGRGHTRAWDAVGRLMFIPVGVVGAYLLTQPGDLHLFPGLENPFGVGLDLRPVIGDRVLAITALGSTLFVPLIGAAFVSRYRAAGQIERLQLRWFAAATILSLAALVVVAIAGALFPGRTGEWPLIAFALTGTTVPLAIGIAILRHHLYDIDRIISRTIGYALVTVVLGSGFIFGVLGGQRLLATIVGDDSTLAIAASTLAAFALFQPVRRRVQRMVDRRFHRARIDGERMTDAFAARLRDQLDLPTLTSELQRATTIAVEPTSSVVWLRKVVGTRSRRSAGSAPGIPSR